MAAEPTHFGPKVKKQFRRIVGGQVLTVKLPWLRANEEIFPGHINIRDQIDVFDHRPQLDVDIGCDFLPDTPGARSDHGEQQESNCEELAALVDAKLEQFIVTFRHMRFG
jgi:hypothetical protein